MTAQLTLFPGRRLSELDPPVRRRDPASSKTAATLVKPKLSSQLLDVLGAVILGGADGMSNREIQVAVCGGVNPGHPAWNKVPTRTKQLWDQGVVERMTTADRRGWLLRSHPSAPGKQGFLVYRVKGALRNV
ncbi:MAG: hypothetical protein L0Z49_00705 [Actinobacteria bacterium]|nr:hypothetical protein [Actinomycetota bacterium]